MFYQAQSDGTFTPITQEFYGIVSAIPEFYTKDDGAGLDGQRRRPVILKGTDKAVAAYLAEQAKPKVPKSVTSRQGVEALIRTGGIDKVQPAIDAIKDSTERAIAQNFWDKSNAFERDNKTLIALSGAIGMTAKDLDALFSYAATL